MVLLSAEIGYGSSEAVKAVRPLGIVQSRLEARVNFT